MSPYQLFGQAAAVEASAQAWTQSVVGPLDEDTKWAVYDACQAAFEAMRAAQAELCQRLERILPNASPADIALVAAAAFALQAATIAQEAYAHRVTSLHHAS